MTLNRYVLYAALIGLLAGGFLVYFFAPNKIKIEEREKIVIKEVKVESTQNIQTKKIKVTKPDGTVIERETFDHKIVENIATKDIEASKEKIKTEINFNKKRFLFYGGVNPLQKTEFIFGTSYNFLGPFDVGASYRNDFFVTIGLRF